MLPLYFLDFSDLFIKSGVGREQVVPKPQMKSTLTRRKTKAQYRTTKTEMNNNNATFFGKLI
jgi:hypothetical protein